MLSATSETRIEIVPEWTDQNGHMNVAYYVLAFDQATDVFYDRLGIGWSYRRREQRSCFTLSMNVDYVREVFAGDRVLVQTRLIDHDEKRLHYFHEMRHAKEGFVCATNELLAIHVNMETRRSESFSPATREVLARVKAQHSTFPLPAEVGRKLGIRRR